MSSLPPLKYHTSISSHQVVLATTEEIVKAITLLSERLCLIESRLECYPYDSGIGGLNEDT